ncbi:MAG: hypothetical protein ABIO36_05265 [Pyrinomonadaceae bacterium]
MKNLNLEKYICVLAAIALFAFGNAVYGQGKTGIKDASGAVVNSDKDKHKVHEDCPLMAKENEVVAEKASDDHSDHDAM